MKKKIIILFLLMVMVIGTIGCGEKKEENLTVNDSKSPDKIILGLQKSITPELIVRYEKKYEEYLGEDVEIVLFDSGADVNTAFASGSIDIGFMGTSAVATGLSNNLDLKVIWINAVIGSAESLVVRKDSGINSIEELKGKRIATPFVSTAHFSLQNALENAGIPINNVNLLDMQPADILAAWKRGDIDGAYVWYPVLGEMLNDGGVVITTSEEQAQTGAITADVSVVRSEFAEQYPEVVKKYIKAQIYGINMFNENHNEAIKSMAGAADITVEAADEQVKGFTYLTAEEQMSEQYLGTDGVGQISQVLKDEAVFLKEQGSITVIPEQKVFEQAVTSKYIGMALEETE